MTDELPHGWMLLFRIEIPIVLVTCIYWFLFPGDYFYRLFGRTGFDAADYILLQQSSIIVFSIFVWFYARVLFSKHVPLRFFRYLQEAASINDTFIIIASVYVYRHLATQGATIIAQIVMTSFWLAVRVIFLLRVNLAEKTV
ncbi:MAG TPA: hypothetical protein VKY31_01630 [Terriglobia bacterium]|nr:hypothetical protein [Terriglobia bacterium]